MKKFLVQLLWFSLPLLLLFMLGIFLPPTKRASGSLLFANRQKDSLLQNVAKPRIIFVGGSNLSFGLNSQMIKDSLQLNPVNTGVHAATGLKYMMDNAIQYIKAGDTVVLIAEYSHFYKDLNSGSEELLRTVFDVNPSKIRLLNLQQIFNLVPFVPKYAISKFKASEYFDVVENEVYSVNSFNQYGDVDAHWYKERVEFEPIAEIAGEYNLKVMKEVLRFRDKVLEKKAYLMISFPCYQELSYLNSADQIRKVKNEFQNSGLIVLGNPERYRFPDSLMFNAPYHLTKPGLDYRTVLFIEEFKKLRSE